MTGNEEQECHFCGSERVTERRETRTTELFGLENVVLKNLRVQVCQDCKEEAFAIPQHERVMSEARACLSLLKRRLTGHEFAFLRDGLGYRGQELARLMKVTPVSVSRWENNKQDVDSTADNFIRLLTLHALGMPGAALLLDVEENGLDRVEIDLADFEEGTFYEFETSYSLSGAQTGRWEIGTALESDCVQVH